MTGNRQGQEGQEGQDGQDRQEGRVFDPGSKARLTTHDLGRFVGDTLFDRVGRAVCHAGCLPRKELYEAWEVARRARRLFRGGRIVDLAGGHGLLAQVLLVLDDSSPSAVVVDRVVPSSATTLHQALLAEWPRLTGRITWQQGELADLLIETTDLVVASHACGALTDAVIARAVDARARVVVLPCCHDVESCDVGPLGGWLDPSTAIDVMRATRLELRGYRVRTQEIPVAITPKNRLILGEPGAAPHC